MDKANDLYRKKMLLCILSNIVKTTNRGKWLGSFLNGHFLFLNELLSFINIAKEIFNLSLAYCFKQTVHKPAKWKNNLKRFEYVCKHAPSQNLMNL